ncbi:hypothetical protein Mgra_00000085 [Meloidogyne graminicola]|uniref:CPG4 domain-containing protein n=2 Tax=Meloidogyne graminicola TaxID=189291 RepID=A0A8T0A339_9BILA|nr:hypothetical protein Mgra_00000085 [Meloidogyne graminicola]
MNKKIFSIFLFKINVIFSISLDLSTIGCDGNCVQEMGKLIEATPSSSSSSSLLLFNEQTLINKFFKNICNSYREVDECLIKCESQSKQVANLKTAYAGLQFVCKQKREEFFNSLPCLSENEEKGVKLCSSQINRSQETTILFTNAIITREFHSMQMRFSALCRDLSSVIKCM